MAQDWTGDPEKLNLAFRVLESMGFSAEGRTEDIVIDGPGEAAPGPRWCDTGYIAGLDDAE